MIPVTMTFRSGETLVIHTLDPDAFAQSVSNAQGCGVVGVDYDRDRSTPDGGLNEVSMTLDGGHLLLCNITDDQMRKALYIQEILECEPSTLLSYNQLLAEESRIDDRLKAVGNVTNNLPDMEVRLYLHKEYIKRTRAYVSALESLIDGVIRRPNE